MKIKSLQLTLVFLYLASVKKSYDQKLLLFCLSDTVV